MKVVIIISSLIYKLSLVLQETATLQDSQTGCVHLCPSIIKAYDNMRRQYTYSTQCTCCQIFPESLSNPHVLQVARKMRGFRSFRENKYPVRVGGVVSIAF